MFQDFTRHRCGSGQLGKSLGNLRGWTCLLNPLSDPLRHQRFIAVCGLTASQIGALFADGGADEGGVWLRLNSGRAWTGRTVGNRGWLDRF